MAESDRSANAQIQGSKQKCESPATPLDDDIRHDCLARAYHALGRQADAERELAQLKVLDGDTVAYDYAEIYAQWGEKSAALQWLTKAERLRDAELGNLRVDRDLDPIRNEPEFKALEARLNLPP